MADKNTPQPLKESFDGQRVRHIADQTAQVAAGFDRRLFLAGCGDIGQLSLMARVRRVAESLQAALPGSYQRNIDALYELAPRLEGGFTTLVLPEYVALFGADHFEASMKALKFFTTFGTSEFAVRHFLQRDLARTLAVMEAWAHDENEHVRRLASEGSRPRLPWSFHIKPLRLDPAPLGGIVDTLRDDPSLYVRRSVANNLNDITKDNPAWVLDRIGCWSLKSAGTAWIAKHALRSLIKQGDPGALGLIGAGSV
ncbi:MAG TPA: DNA alkylation repair protein, partial [Hyphomicrobiales bacterium]|nr:DNA alkylation repair protein [Hyphomicrobiales bacterium]